MALDERLSESSTVEYDAIDMRYMPRVPKDAARLICEQLGFRVAATDGDEVKVEPIQKGVHRYPPVRVSVSVDFEAVDRYINMQPTNWTEIQ